MGVPQGSILSVTLFCLKVNSIVKALCPGVDCSLYVDDFLICYRSKYIHIIEGLLCADVPLRNCSLTLASSVEWQAVAVVCTCNNCWLVQESAGRWQHA